MFPLKITRVVSIAAALASVGVVATAAAYAEEIPAAGSLADICPQVDARDTIQSVRARVAARLGDPIKEEEIDTQYVLTYRRKDGSKLFVILTRDSDRLEATCDTADR